MEDNFNISNQSFDVKKYIFKLIAFWYLFVISGAVSLGIAYYSNRNSVPTYAVNATILIANKGKNTNQLVGGLQMFGSSVNLDNEIGVLKSYFLTEQAMKELDFDVSYFGKSPIWYDVELYKKSPFVIEFDSLSLQQKWQRIDIEIKSQEEYTLRINENFSKKMKFGDTFNEHNFKFKINWRLNYAYDNVMEKKKYYFYFNDRNSLINSYSSRLQVDLRSKSSTILWLWIVGTVPQKEVDFLNTIISVYEQNGLNEKNQIAQSTIEFIDMQLEVVVDSLQKTEDKLQFYRQANKGIDISQEGELLLGQLEELEKERKLTKLRLNYYQFIGSEINKNPELKAIISPTIMGINDELLITVINEIAILNSERDILKLSVKGNLPNMEMLDHKLETYRISLKTHIEKSIEITIKNLTEQNKELAKLEERILDLPIVERRMLNISRKFKLNDQLYTFLLERRTEAGITQASNRSDSRILDKADVLNANRQSPNTSQNRNKALLLGLLFPMLFVFAREFFRTKIVDKSDIEQHVNIPIVGTIGKNDKKTELPVYENPQSPISEAFRAVRTNLQYLLVNERSRVISVSSTTGGEGKTFCSVNLASVFAMSNKRTLVIGLDLRKPKTHINFDIDNSKGISTLLGGYHEYKDIIKKTHIENLYIAPSGPIPPNPAELIESKRMETFLEEAMTEFEYVIIDTPPVAIVTDAMLLTKFSDANIYVIRQNYTNKNALKILSDLQKSGKFRNLGLLINGVDASSAYSTTYGAGFEYSHAYGTESGYYTEETVKRSYFSRKYNDWLEKIKSKFS